MTIFVTPPTEVTDEEVTAASTIETELFGSGPIPEDVIKDTNLADVEVRDIAARLDRPVLRPRVRLLLSRPRIFGTYLKRYADAFPDTSRRGAAQGADFVLDRLAENKLLDRLAAGVPVVTPAIPGSPCDVGGVAFGDLVIPPVATGIDTVLIDAAADLADVSAVGDGMGVFAARTALIDSWAAGEFRFADPEVNRYLYCSVRDDVNLSDADRHGVQARVFGGVFPAAFGRLLTALVGFDQDRCSCPSGTEPSRVRADLAAEEVRFVVDRAVTGVTELQIRGLRAELDRALFVLNTDEVRGQVAGDDPDGVWAVVSRLLERDASCSPDLVAQFAAARARRDLFAWLRYEPGADDPGEAAAFATAVVAALTLQTIEAAPPRPQVPAGMNGQGARLPEMAR